MQLRAHLFYVYSHLYGYLLSFGPNFVFRVVAPF
jgi:hypothetical protein